MDDCIPTTTIKIQLPCNENNLYIKEKLVRDDKPWTQQAQIVSVGNHAMPNSECHSFLTILYLGY